MSPLYRQGPKARRQLAPPNVLSSRSPAASARPAMPFTRTLHAVVATALLLHAAIGQAFVTPPAGQGLPPIPHNDTVFGSGMVAADLDGDGDQDLIFAGPAWTHFRVFRNDGGLTFTDIGVASGLGHHDTVQCLQAADVDNDGDQDLFVGHHLTPARLYINDGTGVFTEQAVARGLVCADDVYGASFGDFDRDGWLDLYLGMRESTAATGAQPNRLYRNTGGGNFVDVTASAGVGGAGTTYVTVFVDYDEDGWPDLFELNDKGGSYAPNELYRNNADGTFTPVGAQTGTDLAIDAMGCDFTDAFHDGGVDVFITDVPNDHLFHVWDPQLSRYTDATYTFGLQGFYVGWACHFWDYDNDGWQDLHVVHSNAPNAVFHNPGTPHAAQTPWPNVAFALGLGQIHNQHTAVTVDLDDDGRVDLVQRYETSGLTAPQGVSVHHNQVPGGNWIKFRTRGVTSNRDGIGARIEVDAGGLNQRQWVRSGVGFLSCADRRVHFGLGASPTIDRVTITWPSGQRQFLSDVPANQIVELVEPHMSAAGTAPVGGSSTISASLQGDEGLPYLLLMSFSTANGIALPSGDVFPLDHDALLSLTLDPSNPILVGSVGTVPANGEATATLHVPPLPLLSGLTCYSAALTTDVPSFPVVRTVVAKPIAIQIQ